MFLEQSDFDAFELMNDHTFNVQDISALNTRRQDLEHNLKALKSEYKLMNEQHERERVTFANDLKIHEFQV